VFLFFSFGFQLFGPSRLSGKTLALSFPFGRGDWWAIMVAIQIGPSDLGIEKIPPATFSLQIGKGGTLESPGCNEYNFLGETTFPFAFPSMFRCAEVPGLFCSLFPSVPPPWDHQLSSYKLRP